MSRNHNETKLQISTADYLRGEVRYGRNVLHVTKPFPQLKFNHPANEGRSEADGAKYKRMGVMPGMTDWQFWGPAKWHGLCELKIEGGSLSVNQKDVKHWAIDYGFPYALCRSVTELRDTLIGWGWQCYNMACIEPNYITLREKFSQAHDFYKPL